MVVHFNVKTGLVGPVFSSRREQIAHGTMKANSVLEAQIQLQSLKVERFSGFKPDIIDEIGEIDRGKLAGIVFSDQQALRDLEGILHPLVVTAATNLVTHARLPIIVIEAIKLLESALANMCDSVWVVDADDEIIMNRLKMQPKFCRIAPIC